jgi:hypothetical protein
LYQNEDYILQLDAHIRMVKNWDELLIEEYSKLKQKYQLELKIKICFIYYYIVYTGFQIVLMILQNITMVLMKLFNKLIY